MSLNTLFKPFKKTTLGIEISRGFNGDVAGNAYRTNLNTQFSIFSAQGEYYNVGKNYPGYFSNSKCLHLKQYYNLNSIVASAYRVRLQKMYLIRRW